MQERNRRINKERKREINRETYLDKLRNGQKKKVMKKKIKK